MSVQSDPSIEAPPGGCDVASPSRRLLLRGGLGAAPVVMTFSSLPASAATCVAASAFTSLTPSGQARAARTAATCGGMQPSTWSSASSTAWPSGVTANSKFQMNLGFSSVPSGLTPSDPKLGVLFALASPSDEQKVAQHCAAAVLNSRTGSVPATILSETLAKKIWSDYKATGGGTMGYYVPAPGVKWYSDSIINWIKTTYGS